MQRSCHSASRVFFVGLFLLSLSLASSALAIVRHVPADYATIQAAIDAAVVGDIVEIACGTYQVPEIIMKSGITLRSETGQADCVVLEPTNAYPAEGKLLRCQVDVNTQILGITFQGGYSLYCGVVRIDGSPAISNCKFTDNRGRYVGGFMSATEPQAADPCNIGEPVLFEGSSSLVTNCEFVGNNASSGGIRIEGGGPVFVGCTFDANRAADDAGAIDANSGTFVDCEFSFNHVYFDGGAVHSSGSALFQSCTFHDNSANFSGGAVLADGGTFLDCLFYLNRCGLLGYAVPLSGGGAIYLRGGVVTRCTFWGNDATMPSRAAEVEASRAGGASLSGVHGSAILVDGNATLSRLVVQANTGSEAIYCENNASISFSCSDIFGNPGGDWTGCIAGQLGVNGNISVDPMFCDAAGGDFHLSSLSPCLYAECGVMGALGQGCFDAKPALYQVQDVGNDEGRQVRLTWQRSLHDSPTSNPYVVGYAVYRKQGQFASGDVKDAPIPQAARGEGAAILGWDYLGTVPSRGDSVYEAVMPTLCDSTITSGPCLSTFFVSAMTSNPFIYYDSPQQSGYSKDNLAPPTPTSFAVAYNTGDGNHLSWDAVAAGDFAGFRVYRDDVWVASTTQTSWNDPAFDGWNVHYEVTSFDMAGNESAPATGGITTGVPSVTPPQLELLPNVPNPFNPTTQIRFATPSEGTVRVAIYDARGALVRVLVDKWFPAGHHSAVWDGRDTNGSPVSSGVYMCKLEQQSDSRTRKIVLIK